MNFPRYWAKGTVEIPVRDRRTYPFTAWGWSDASPADARRKGEERANHLGQRILRGDRPDRYLYGDHPVREQVLEEFRDSRGSLAAAITRNSYGCQVLNTANIMFVDIDLRPATLLEAARYQLRRLLGRSVPHPQQQRETEAIAKLESLVKTDPRQGVRVYRTRAGLRYLFTHRPAVPDATTTLKLMEHLGADPLYVRLCQQQKSYRARLTPKPWRCGFAALPIRWPWQSVEEESRFREWESRYIAASRLFATCRLIREFGSPTTHPDVRSTVELHDQLTRATSRLDLA